MANKSIEQIYQTNNYKQFTFDNINRKLNTGRVAKLMKDYQVRNIISPIEVMKNKQGKYVILDGQHRFEAWKNLGLPITYFETISGDDSTQGLRQRNLGQAWSTMDIVNSFACDQRYPKVQKQYQELEELIQYVRDTLGPVPYVPVIELATGINRALDQQVVYAHHDFRDGKYTTKNRQEFMDIINSISIVQSRLTEPIKLTASMFRTLFTMAAVKDFNAAFLAISINKNRAKFDEISAHTNDKDVSKAMFSFYNRSAELQQAHQPTLSWHMGVKGIHIDDSLLRDVFLANEKIA